MVPYKQAARWFVSLKKMDKEVVLLAKDWGVGRCCFLLLFSVSDINIYIYTHTIYCSDEACMFG